MYFGVVVFPGSNCDHDCYHVISHVLKEKAAFLWHKDKGTLEKFDCIVLPGGFSYGDYLRTGAIARFSPIMEEVAKFAKRGGLVLGICNGFQILLEAELLPGAMMRNRSLKFICQDVYLKVENNHTPFSSKINEKEVLKLPIAHADGHYFADEKTLADLKEFNQIVFRYSTQEGEIQETANPNGSVENIAGICNKERNVLAMMPHPERACEKILGNIDGLKIFKSILNAMSF